jgi:hypothetical protein
MDIFFKGTLVSDFFAYSFFSRESALFRALINSRSENDFKFAKCWRYVSLLVDRESAEPVLGSWQNNVTNYLIVSRCLESNVPPAVTFSKGCTLAGFSFHIETTVADSVQWDCTCCMTLLSVQGRIVHSWTVHTVGLCTVSWSANPTEDYWSRISPLCLWL